MVTVHNRITDVNLIKISSKKEKLSQQISYIHSELSRNRGDQEIISEIYEKMYHRQVFGTEKFLKDTQRWQTEKNVIKKKLFSEKFISNKSTVVNPYQYTAT